jgi:hypothetical protein
MRPHETERSVKGHISQQREGGSSSPPLGRKSPWKTQVIGALIGLVLFIVIVGVLYILFSRFR